MTPIAVNGNKVLVRPGWRFNQKPKDQPELLYLVDLKDKTVQLIRSQIGSVVSDQHARHWLHQMKTAPNSGGRF
jgi:hypothetical protein